METPKPPQEPETDAPLPEASEEVTITPQTDKPSAASDLQSDDMPEITENEQSQKETEDEEAMVAGVAVVGRISIWVAHVKRFWLKIWQTPKYRRAFFGSLIALVLLLGIIPASRYGVLNAIGLRSQLSVIVLDEQTNQPLEGVSVQAGSVASQTNADGRATLENTRLGGTELVIDKLAYAEYRSDITLGMGDNTIEDISLKPVGTQFAFSGKDWLSGLPVAEYTVRYQDSNARSDSDGLATITIPPTDEEEITIEVSAEGYHTVEAVINTTSTAINETILVASPGHYFLSERSGQFDLYSSRLDGSEEKLLVPGTASESDRLRFSVSPANDYGALVSTRTGARDNEGNLLWNLNIVKLESGELQDIASSADIQLIDWIGTRLIYVSIGPGESAYSPRRHVLMSYDTSNGSSTELEASNYFNDVAVIQGKIYYAADDSFKQERPKAFVYRIEADGSNRQIVLERQSWTLFRTEYNRLVINTTKNGWFEYKIDSEETTELDGQPARLETRRYQDSADGKKAAWVDERDGKGVLLVYNRETKQEEVVYQAGGLSAPLRWINDDMIIFRINTTDESADYIVSLKGESEPQKITDVSNIEATGRWFYY
jgi:hypothetical protein